MGLVGLLLVVVGFGVYGIWRYQVWLPLVANDAGLSISNPENVPIKLASGRTIDDFLDLFPEAAKKKKVVLEFHSQMPEENNSYAFMKDSTWGPNGVGVACGSLQDLDKLGEVKKLDVYLTLEKLVEKMGREEATKQINNVIRTCLTQTYATGFLDQRDYQSLSQKVQQEFGSTPLLELAL